MLITMKDCDIRDRDTTIIKRLSWQIPEGTAWCVTGANGSGKSVLVSALAGRLDVVPSENGRYANACRNSAALVSFETAAELIEAEARNDDSDFVEGGVDAGRTAREYIAEALMSADATRFAGSANAAGPIPLERHPAVALCRIAHILDRGLKYLSTGEIRRTLLCRALATKPSLLILDEPFAGLDTESRAALSAYLSDDFGGARATYAGLIVVMDRPDDVPACVTHVLELTDRAASFCGTLADYRAARPTHPARTMSVPATLTCAETARLVEARERRANATATPDTLIEMNDVTVAWSDRVVLDRLSWTLRAGEHWLIRGPNGSGKTTLLELITGDNPQVFRNDVRLFGRRRGSGETIWELKEKMGIVTYRLHAEYRSLGDVPLRTVLVSGLHDSIGLYEQSGEEERSLADTWLALVGFEGRGDIPFRDLSYGEQRALLIARAAIKQPPLLILDEPCHGLDSVHRARILALLQRIAELGGSTLLHVTHDETEVLPCEKRILELRPGQNPMYAILER